LKHQLECVNRESNDRHRYLPLQSVGLLDNDGDQFEINLNSAQAGIAEAHLLAALPNGVSYPLKDESVQP
jgi:hypothetical protein